MKIFIPSYKRAGNVKSRKIFPSGIIVCSESEADAYRSADGEPLMVVPDLVQGNIARVRNYIFDHGEDDKILMIDDDYNSFGYCERGVQISMKPEEIIAFLWKGFIMAEDMGIHLWGVNVQSDPKFYREYSPFSFTAPVLGPFQAHYKPEFRYNETDLHLKEDYDFFLMNIHKYRKVLRFNKFYYIVDHINKKGGCGAYRTKGMEEDQLNRLRKKWGNHIVSFDLKKSINPILHVPFGDI
jgi:hypothetical protein